MQAARELVSPAFTGTFIFGQEMLTTPGKISMPIRLVQGLTVRFINVAIRTDTL